MRGRGIRVAEVRDDVEAALVVAGHRNRVQRGQRFQPLRHDHFVLPLVPAPVDPAPLHAAAQAETGVGADERAAGIDRALGRRQLHADVDHAILRLIHIGQHIDHGEIIGAVQRLLQIQQLILRKIVAGLERYVAVEETVVELRAFEVHLAVAIAWTGMPRQLDAGAAIGAGHFDPMGEQPGIEEAIGGELRTQYIAGGVVGAVIQRLALHPLECTLRATDRSDPGSRFVQLHVDGGDLHRFAGFHVQCDLPVLANLLQVAGDGSVVVAVGLQRGFHLIGCTLIQASQLRVADLTGGILRQLDARDHRGLQWIRDPIHGQLHAGMGSCRQQHQRQ